MAEIVGNGLELALWPSGTAPVLTAFTLNASDDALEFIFQVHEAITIVDVGFRQGLVTGTSPVYKASLQGVTNGVPDGIILGGGTPASVTFTPVSGGNNTWQWKTLDNSIAVVRGQWVALVIARDSGTIDGSNNCSFNSTSAVVASTKITGAYAIENNSTVRTRMASPVFGYRSSTVAYGVPVQTAINTAFHSGSTPDERGNAIVVPTTWVSNYTIVGATIYGTFAAATTFDVVVYDSDGTTVRQTTTFDTDNDQQSTAARSRDVFFDTTNLYVFSAGTKCFLMLKPAGTSLNLAGFTVGSVADMDAYVGGSAVCHAATKTDGGAMSEDTLTRYAIVPKIHDWTVSSGGVSAVIGE